MSQSKQDTALTPCQSTLKILDGGMGRELDRRGAPFRRPEWSALALMEQPSAVQAVHEDYLTSGADIITTNSYAVVPFHIGEEKFATEGKALIELSGKLAQQARANKSPQATIVGSIPPFFGSYRADLFDDNADRILEIATPLITGLMDYVDVWLLETQSLIAESQAVIPIISNYSHLPVWIACTLEDDIDAAKNTPCLRSGETVEKAVNTMIDMMVNDIKPNAPIEAILFNCCQPEVIEQALIVANSVIAERNADIQTGAYANAFPPQNKDVDVSEFHNEIRDLTPDEYLQWARKWVNTGATIIGGCCGIGPAHIEVLADNL